MASKRPAERCEGPRSDPPDKTDRVHRRESDPLPIRELAEYLGMGPSVLHTPEVPRYVEMARYVFDRLGCVDSRWLALDRGLVGCRETRC